ncbi:2-isopropylmalate synthase [Granulicella mallensis]|uniref:2-isopropylmalate synthase n=1 Tax=Granulicella mallensis (strain ATCC BAA-1857 / DSM 23137 / MP5ACTX8) TaxID=682795 RepID=G8NXZ4_GRAMM|nr:2-isopropylmalate synthase [Granulicella mallensis]AEU35582.1 2-isopropylmalate synthase [Granulicella mallensis MP5ACTX8]
MAHTDQIVFFDTTLRDGEQSPGCTMHPGEKLRFAHQLAALGVDIIEAGFPIASAGDFDSVRTIAKEVKGVRIAALARAKQADIESAARAVEPAQNNRIHTFLSSSDIHLEHQMRMSRAQALDLAAESVRRARSFVDNVEFSPMDATRTEAAFLCEMVKVAVQAGATTINIPDTVGYVTPSEYTAIFRMLRELPGMEGVIFSTHCHDDLGLAVANTLAGIEGGARQVEVAVNGIGERAGNAALEEVAAALLVRRDVLPYTSNIVNTQLYPTSALLAEIVDHPVAPNKAVVGKNAFAHESGIHQHGVLANPLTYEIMTPASVGVTATTIVLGKHSGRRALEHRLTELGHTLTREELDSVYHRFTELADRKKSIYDQDIVALLNVHSAEPLATPTP